MKITILTLFPDYFQTPFASSILARAQQNNQVQFEVVNIRDFTTDKHHTADDTPYGGGPGMVMKIEPIDKALQSHKSSKLQGIGESHNVTTFQRDSDQTLQSIKVAKLQSSKASEPQSVLTILTSAKGKLFTQQIAREYSQLEELVIICGHYEGVDERVAEHLVDEEVRIGDYVLTGGEPAAAVIADAITRLLPEVLGNDQSANDESHSVAGQLEYPQYTRPENYHGWQVPDVLLSGNHAEIVKWREEKKKYSTIS